MATENATFARELGDIQKEDPAPVSKIKDSQNMKYTHTHTHTHNLHKDQSIHTNLLGNWQKNG
jgi:hypothetical protein